MGIRGRRFGEGRKRLLLFGCTYLPQASEINTEQAAQIACSLKRFPQWCVEHHDVPIDEEVIAALESLPDGLLQLVAMLVDVIFEGRMDGIYMYIS